MYEWVCRIFSESEAAIREDKFKKKFFFPLHIWQFQKSKKKLDEIRVVIYCTYVCKFIHT